MFGLQVSLKKTKVFHQPAPQEEYHAPDISIEETDLKSVQQFTYLGCTISLKVKIDGEINNRLAKANCASVKTCVEQQAPKMQNKDHCLLTSCTDHPPIQL